MQGAAVSYTHLDVYKRQVLARGYAMVQDNRGRICTPDALRPGQTCKLRGTEHRVTCTVNTVEELDESTQKL